MIIQRTENILLSNRSFLNYFNRSPDTEYLLVRKMSLLHIQQNSLCFCYQLEGGLGGGERRSDQVQISSLRGYF